MKVKVDNRLLALEFGRQSVQTDQVRYYYQLAGFEDVILVTQPRRRFRRTRKPEGRWRTFVFGDRRMLATSLIPRLLFR